MRKRPKVAAKNVSKNHIKQNDFQQLLFPWFMLLWLVGCLFTHIFTLIFDTFPSVKITFGWLHKSLNQAVKEQITVKLQPH